MSTSSSRIPSPVVGPVVFGSTRFEQLWTLKVYDSQRTPGKEGDVQDTFFKSMQTTSAGMLLIENERGARYLVDPVMRSVTTVPAQTDSN